MNNIGSFTDFDFKVNDLVYWKTRRAYATRAYVADPNPAWEQENCLRVKHGIDDADVTSIKRLYIPKSRVIRVIRKGEEIEPRA